MPTIKKALLKYETNVTPFAMEALTDSGDHLNYTSNASMFSLSDGNAPDVRPDGIINGGSGIPAISGTDDLIDVAKVLCYLAGIETTVNAATDLTALRGATTNTHRINSLTITSAGAFSIVSGTASTAFSEVRNAAGGPPYIPVGSIEVLQIRLTSITAAPVTAAEIFDVIGTHKEVTFKPSFKLDTFKGEINFDSALPPIHTGDTAKKVYASYAEPIFIEQERANSFVPALNTASTNSNQTYSGTDASVSVSLNGGTFVATLNDGITDDILSQVDNTIFVTYYPDRFKAAHYITQGYLSATQTNDAGANPQANFTISPETPSVRVAV